jgi:aldehyde dehydrogenase (NAD+)
VGKAQQLLTSSADIDLAAKRIANSKFMGTGQVCLAATHGFVDLAVHDQFVERLSFWFERYFNGSTGQFSRIINQRNFDRLIGMLERTRGKITHGRSSDRIQIFISPTVVTGVDFNGL